MTNPYYPRGVLNPKYFANREEVLEFFKQNVLDCASSEITKPDNIIILGDWGVGKTSALYKFNHIILEELGDDIKALSVYYPLSPSTCRDYDSFSFGLLQSIARQYKTNATIKDKISDIIKEESKIWENWQLEKLSLSPEIQRKVEKHSQKEALVKLWKKLEEKKIHLVIVMLDDIHYLITNGWNGSLYDLRTDIQYLQAEGTKFMFIVTGSKFVYPEIHEIAEPFTRLFEKYEIGNFDKTGTNEAINLPLRVENIQLDISSEVVERIFEMTEGHPFFINFIMRDVLRKINSGKLDTDTFDSLLQEIYRHLNRTKFNDDFNKASDAEKDVLIGLSKIGKKEFSPSDVRSKSATKLFERLTKKDLLLKSSRGRYKIYHPLFAEFLNTMEV